MAEEELCSHGNKISTVHLYNKQAQKLEFINEGIYRSLRCCGEPMRKKAVRAIYNCGQCGCQKAIFIKFAECSCCGKEIPDFETKPAKRLLRWLGRKFGKKDG